MDFIIDPEEIEEKSMKIIKEKIKEFDFSSAEAQIVKRVVHATADFEYADLLVISEEAIERGATALREGADIVTDVNMLKEGITKGKIAEFGNQIHCFISDPETASQAQELGITRSMMSMRRAVQDSDNRVFAIGNAPTALFELIKLIRQGAVCPELVVGTPIGFVGASQSKSELEKLDIPHITVRGRKGGSPVAASIVNALLYMV